MSISASETPVPATGTTTTAAGPTARKSLDFFEPLKPELKCEEGVKYGDKKYHETSPVLTISKSSSCGLSTEVYKAMRNKSGATSSSSSSQATVLSAGSKGTSAATTSSDDSDDLISYKSSASTNALLAQSQAMTTTQLMSKYLKREPRVQFTTITSPDSPLSPPREVATKFSYQLTNKSNGSDTTAVLSEIGATTSEGNASAAREFYFTLGVSEASPNSRAPSPSGQINSLKNSQSASLSSTAAAPLLSSRSTTGHRLFDSLASAGSTSHTTGGTASAANYESRSAAAGSGYDSSKSQEQTHQRQPLSNSEQQHKLQQSQAKSMFNTGGPFSGNTSNDGSIHNAMSIYGTLPKNGSCSNGGGNSSSALFNSHSSYYSSATSGTAGLASNYDFYNSSAVASGRTFANGSSSNGAGSYHTLGAYRVQYVATNPFLEAFDAPSATGGAGNGGLGLGATEQMHHHRTSLMAAFQSGDSKNGSDEYDDLK